MSIRKRRLRRQAKAALKNPKAKPKHKLKTGRTGSVFSKQLQSRRK